MHEIVEIRVLPEELSNLELHHALIRSSAGFSGGDRFTATLIRRSLDARFGKIEYVLRFEVRAAQVSRNQGESSTTTKFTLELQSVHDREEVIIVGAGPAGLFAALRLIELGLKPIVIERGKEVRDRRRDLARITKFGEVNPDSNYCFGEGGAGTFSDGKLYTRSTKRGSVSRVLEILKLHGAPDDIMIDAHPHIGTNRLPKVVQALRESILSAGGVFLFNERVEDLILEGQNVVGVRTPKGKITARSVILAPGHSARDVFSFLVQAGVSIHAKPFALGVRVEHPQELIDAIQYHCPRTDRRSEFLPPARYSIQTQAENRGVYSFCMCPGGIICPAATAPEEIVVNGWSPSKRNSKFANSGLVLEIALEDIEKTYGSGPLSAMEFQQAIEQRAFQLGGGAQQAPAQRMQDFIDRRPSQSLPESSYIPGLTACSLDQLFPESITERLRTALKTFGNQKRGFLTNEAVLVGVESRTSSPVRIPRDPATGMHPNHPGLFPCGEGAGYAGGIVSAAMDGERIATLVAQFYTASR